MEKMMTKESFVKQNPFKRIKIFSWVKKSILIEIIAHLFIILFVYTGVAKLMDFSVFKVQLEDSPVLQPVAPIVAWGLPIIEFLVSILLFFPKFRLKGLYATFALMILFTTYVITLLTISTELPCSCGGIIEELSWQGHLLFNSSLLLLSFAAIYMQRKLNRTKEITEERYLSSHV